MSGAKNRQWWDGSGRERKMVERRVMEEDKCWMSKFTTCWRWMDLDEHLVTIC